MADQTSPPAPRRSRWLYEFLFLSIADWARQPSPLAHANTRPHEEVRVGATERELGDGMKEQVVNSYAEHHVARSMGHAQASYAHACLLEEGRGKAKLRAFLAKESHGGICVDEDGDDETTEEAEIEDGDAPDHPNLRMQWRWTAVSERDTE
ncbi:hypothetical protein G6011_10707 [Alternaria panax]|uniref:Uncharacterized protein n=1 Tax=Alternaria panax TaxID=48097 RepID=A0AAD4IC59_9PLEO|nr:hypothetical protein G6011_10707 [Alternaria panax]